MIGDVITLSMKINRNEVVVVNEDHKHIKVCCKYRMQGESNWEPVYHLIQKKDILKIKNHGKFTPDESSTKEVK